jgi:hypothetical protein
MIHIDQQHFRLYIMNDKPYCQCILILQQKLIVEIEKNYNVDETRVVNTDRLWICRKINFQLEALATVTMAISKKLLAEGR